MGWSEPMGGCDAEGNPIARPHILVQPVLTPSEYILDLYGIIPPAIDQVYAISFRVRISTVEKYAVILHNVGRVRATGIKVQVDDIQQAYTRSLLFFGKPLDKKLQPGVTYAI